MKRFIFILIGVVVVCIAAYLPLFSGVRSNTSSLKNDELGIEAEYPADIFTATTTTAYLPPEFEKRYEGPGLLHTAPYEHCDLSGLPGHCTPTTKDLSIGFFEVEKPFSGMRDALKSTFGDLVQPILFGGREGMMVETGVEGEGTFYYLLPLNVSTTLAVTRSYMNEAVLSGYRNAKDFIPYADQEKIFNEVLSTLVFQD